VAEQRSMQTVALLELALRAHSQPEMASRAVTVALDRRSLAAEIADLIDSQLASADPSGARWTPLESP
jgi:hypothetical protein